jgi:hypothetical protein
VNLILEDAQAAVEFVRKDLVALLDSPINPEKLALTGGSAGGWLGGLSADQSQVETALIDDSFTCWYTINHAGLFIISSDLYSSSVSHG